MSTDLYERMMDKYGYLQEAIDLIVNIKPTELDSLISVLIDKIQTNKINWELIYRAIRNICEVNINYIREYWYIYEEIYKYCKIKPKLYSDEYIIDVLFAKKYNVNIKWESHYKICKNKNFDEIFNYYKSDPAMCCIIHDDIKSLKEIILSGPYFDFNQKLFEKSLIENCCFCGAVECFRFLRSNGIEITKKCLDYSIVGRNISIINECLQYIDPDKDTMNKIIEIHNFDMAISFKHIYRIEISIRHVALHLNIRLFFYLMSNRTNFDVFFINSFSFQNQELIHDILSLGAKIESKDEDGTTPLIYAACKNNVEAITKLVKLGANIEAQENNGQTPLFGAAYQNNVEAITKLVKLGANIDAQDNYGQTPLFGAAFNNNVEAITKLVEFGANIEAKNKNGYTPLIRAAGTNCVDAITKLVELGANIEAKDKYNYTPLVYAVLFNNVEAITKLVKLGANIESKGKVGETPLVYAVLKNNVEAIIKLVELGANIEAKNKFGYTPLQYAVKFNRIEAITKLEELGANIEA